MSETAATRVFVEFHETDPDTGRIDLANMAMSMAAEIARLRETHATALATVQALHRDALQQRDDVTKELEEAKALLKAAYDDARALRTLLNTYNLGGWTDTVGPVKRALAAEDQLATARLDTLREVETWLEIRHPLIAADMHDAFVPTPKQEGTR